MGKCNCRNYCRCEWNTPIHLTLGRVNTISIPCIYNGCIQQEFTESRLDLLCGGCVQVWSIDDPATSASCPGCLLTLDLTDLSLLTFENGYTAEKLIYQQCTELSYRLFVNGEAYLSGRVTVDASFVI